MPFAPPSAYGTTHARVAAEVRAQRGRVILVAQKYGVEDVHVLHWVNECLDKELDVGRSRISMRPTRFSGKHEGAVVVEEQGAYPGGYFEGYGG